MNKKYNTYLAFVNKPKQYNITITDILKYS